MFVGGVFENVRIGRGRRGKTTELTEDDELDDDITLALRERDASEGAGWIAGDVILEWVETDDVECDTEMVGAGPRPRGGGTCFGESF